MTPIISALVIWTRAAKGRIATITMASASPVHCYLTDPELGGAFGTADTLEDAVAQALRNITGREPTP